GLAGLAGVIGVVVWRRAHRAAAGACTSDACAVDGSCGCIGGPASAREHDVAACTLEPDQLPGRLQDFRALLAGAMVARERSPGRFVWIFRASPATAAT